MNYPKVTILMSVYNGERFLRRAIESILTQTYQDFEFLIIDDGSTDSTAKILKTFQKKDPRIQIYPQKNKGLSFSLRKGVKLAKGEYLARIDSDDLSYPQRIEKQIRFMEEYPNLGLVASAVDISNEEGKIIRRTLKNAEKNLEIKWITLFDCPVAHSSVLLRKKIVLQAGNYSSELRVAQDYDLWCKMSRITDFYCLPESLVCRTHSSRNISIKHFKLQQEQARKISLSYIRSYLTDDAIFVSNKSLLAFRSAWLCDLSRLESFTETIKISGRIKSIANILFKELTKSKKKSEKAKLAKWCLNQLNQKIKSCYSIRILLLQKALKKFFLKVVSE